MYNFLCSINLLPIAFIGAVARQTTRKILDFGTTLGQLPQQNITTYNNYKTCKPAFYAGLTRYNNL